MAPRRLAPVLLCFACAAMTARGEAPRWPDADAPVGEAAPVFPRRFGTRRIFIDPGHGFGANVGNVSVRCEREEDFTLRAAQELAARLEKTRHFVVRLGRRGERVTSYEARVARAAAWGADAFLSLHSDARGPASLFAERGGLSCYRNDGDPGFAVLWSDDASEPLAGRRASLARAVARWMSGAGFLPYDGRDYGGLYEGDALEPGVFADRHVPGRRIYVLRHAPMPSVIIETHHALDWAETARWDEASTYDAFANAVAQALIDAL